MASSPLSIAKAVKAEATRQSLINLSNAERQHSCLAHRNALEPLNAVAQFRYDWVGVRHCAS